MRFALGTVAAIGLFNLGFSLSLLANHGDRLVRLESTYPAPATDESREFAAMKLDGLPRQACRYERRDLDTGVLTCWYRRTKTSQPQR